MGKVSPQHTHPYRAVVESSHTCAHVLTCTDIHTHAHMDTHTCMYAYAHTRTLQHTKHTRAVCTHNAHTCTHACDCGWCRLSLCDCCDCWRIIISMNVYTVSNISPFNIVGKACQQTFVIHKVTSNHSTLQNNELILFCSIGQLQRTLR
jgi:hypothetical protein